jgi:hypothetical protein
VGFKIDFPCSQKTESTMPDSRERRPIQTARPWPRTHKSD